ncbi:MAG: phosphodiesterase [Thiobacillaceae bacterium]|jgi:Icc protein
MILIAQISDIHLRLDGQLVEGRVDTAACLASCVERINSLPARPQLAIASGDLAETGNVGEYLHLKGLLARLAMPYVVMPGNHDLREGMRTVFGGTAALPAAAAGHLQYLVELPTLNLICLDTLDEGKESGWMCSDRLNWLHDTLNSHKTPCLIILHHPPFDCGIPGMDRIKLANARALADVLSEHYHVIGLSCGHVHRTAFTRWANLPACICPSPAHQIHLDSRPDAPLAWTLEPGGFLLHQWDGKNLVTHAVFGPVPEPTVYK